MYVQLNLIHSVPVDLRKKMGKNQKTHGVSGRRAGAE